MQLVLAIYCTRLKILTVTALKRHEIC
jgi:hypothetical protein